MTLKKFLLLFGTLLLICLIWCDCFGNEEKPACPHCSFLNDPQDRYCLNCSKPFRKLSRNDIQKMSKAKDAQFDYALKTTQEIYYKAQSLSNLKKRKAYLLKALTISEPLLNQSTSRSKSLKLNKLVRKINKDIQKLNRLGVDDRIEGEVIIPLQGSQRAWFTPVTINKEETILLQVDTGASSVVLPNSVLKKMNIPLKHVGISRVADGRKVKTYRAKLSSFQVGPIEKKNFFVHTLKTDKDTSGLLGMSFLKDYNFEIQVDKKRMVLRPKKLL